jgi:hypothetical protein
MHAAISSLLAKGCRVQWRAVVRLEERVNVRRRYPNERIWGTEKSCPRIIFSWEVNFTLSAQEAGMDLA